MSKLTKLAAGIGAFVAIAVGGGAIGAAASSNGGSSASSSAAARPAFNGPAHGSAAHENAEKAVSGSAAAKAKAAAIKAAGGGIAGDVTSDYTGGGYEVTVQKSDGSSVEIHLASSFSAMGGPGGFRGAPPASGAIAPPA